MRAFWVLIHRWFGLFIAAFLFVAGATGAIISWDHELDEWLNAHLFDVDSRGPYLQPLDLAARIEAADPRRRVTYVPLQFKDGHAAAFSVAARVDPATKQAHEIGHNQVFVDPVTGDILGQREWGKAGLDREHLLPFLYKLHYSLHIPEMASIDRWGIWFMGIVGIVWLFDCFVGFYLTLPPRKRASTTAGTDYSAVADVDQANGARTYWQRWKQSWQVKWPSSSYRLNLDLHRASGLWFWLLLIVVAFTSISMNLQYEVVRPLLQTVSSLTPSPYDTRAPRSRHEPAEPQIDFATAIARAQMEAAGRGWPEPPGYAFYSPDFGVFAIGFFPAGEDPHGAGGLGVKTIFLDADGSTIGDQVPLKGTAADMFMQLQFPLHSGRIAGVPGRILISVMGLVIALLSFTGIVIWFKKRAARLRARHRRVVPAGARSSEAA